MFQKLNDAAARLRVAARRHSSSSGFSDGPARLTVTLASDSPASAIQLRTRERLRLGDWYHVALTYDGSGKAAGLRLYVDGEPADVEIVQDALAGPMPATRR